MTEPRSADRLPPERLRWRCAPEQHDFEGEPGVTPEESTLGQDRAVEALRLGLNIDAPGFNVFVAGPNGSGRTFTVRRMLEDIERKTRLEEDRAFVHNFEDRDRPRLLRLPRGQGKAFKTAMKDLVAALPELVERTMRDEALSERRREIIEEHKLEAKSVLAAIDERITDEGFVAVEVQQGPRTFKAIIYSLDDEPVTFESLRRAEEVRNKFVLERARKLRQDGKMLPSDEAEREALIDEEIDALEKRAHEVSNEVDEALSQASRIERKAGREVKDIEQDALRKAISVDLEDIKKTFDSEGIAEHLDQVLEHILDNLHLFHTQDDEEEETDIVELLTARRSDGEEDLWVYEVNIVQQAATDEKPVVYERHPTFTNLFGTIERRVLPSGNSESRNFTNIRPGSMLRADGGFLVLNARDVLLEPGVWRTLVRTLSSKELEIQPPETSIYLMPSALKPDAIPLDLKVILIGDHSLYHLLLHYEGEFRKIFKVKAEFDSSIDHSEENVAGFVDTIRALVERQSSLPLAPDGFGVLLEEAVRLAGRKNRVSTQFGVLADIIAEAGFWAKEEDPEADRITAPAVRRALESRISRHALADEHYARYMREEVLLIDTAGEKVGQINGLAVYGIGDHHFGKPSRITASVGAGSGGLVNIEREARLSGPSHDKGVMILAGYLRYRYGRDRPLAITASIAFEQSYGGVDGDSASLAELYALMSSIADVPIRQNIAITGSMNQRGDAQAIGGVNEKVEGFFELCKDRALDGSQGCIIPQANVESLMLRSEVVEAVQAEQFAVWSIRHADEAIPILFGMPAQELHNRVAARLEKLSEVQSPPGEKTVERETTGYTGDLPKPPRDPRPPTPTGDPDD